MAVFVEQSWENYGKAHKAIQTTEFGDSFFWSIPVDLKEMGKQETSRSPLRG